MKALILAAGLGSRLKKKTQNIPKALIKIKSKPIISLQIEALKYNKIDQIGVVLGYKSDILKNYLLKTHKDIKFSFFMNKDYELSNSAFSFYQAREYVKNISYIHLNCDVIFSKKLLSDLIMSKNKNVIALSKKISLKDNMEQVKLDLNKKILKMDNMKFKEAVFKAYGLAKFSAESTNYVLKKIKFYLEKNEKNKNYYGILRQAVLELDYYGINASDRSLLEVNTLSDLEIAIQTL
jgi:choline kinase